MTTTTAPGMAAGAEMKASAGVGVSELIMLTCRTSSTAQHVTTRSASALFFLCKAINHYQPMLACTCSPAILSRAKCSVYACLETVRFDRWLWQLELIFSAVAAVCSANDAKFSFSCTHGMISIEYDSRLCSVKLKRNFRCRNRL